MQSFTAEKKTVLKTDVKLSQFGKLTLAQLGDSIDIQVTEQKLEDVVELCKRYKFDKIKRIVLDVVYKNTDSKYKAAPIFIKKEILQNIHEYNHGLDVVYSIKNNEYMPRFETNLSAIDKNPSEYELLFWCGADHNLFDQKGMVYPTPIRLDYTGHISITDSVVDWKQGYDLEKTLAHLKKDKRFHRLEIVDVPYYNNENYNRFISGVFVAKSKQEMSKISGTANDMSDIHMYKLEEMDIFKISKFKLKSRG